MKKLLLFIGAYYYPLGGWSDFKDDFNSLEEIFEYIIQNDINGDWIQVVDRDSKKIVWKKD